MSYRPVVHDNKVVMTDYFTKRPTTRSRCLPETLTVTLGGFAAAFPDVSRIPLAFSACTGWGVAGYVNAPPMGGTPGPVDSPILTSGGGGYAAIGRVEPTITGDGNASVAFTLIEEAGVCGWPYWRISAASVTSPGSSGYYTDNERFYPSYGPEVTVVSAASLRVRTVRAAPTLYIDDSVASGTGASISLTATEGTDFEGRAKWSVTGYSIDASGTGYNVWDYLGIVTSDGVGVVGGFLLVESVGDSGEITGVTIADGGEYFRDTGTADIIEIDGGGVYYEEDATEPLLVATVTATVDGGGGAGATFNVSVDDDPESPTFGSVDGITLDDGGDDYNGTIFERQCCDTALDGKTFVLRQGTRSCAREGYLLNDVSTVYFTGNTLTYPLPFEPEYKAHTCRETSENPVEGCEDVRPACVFEHRFCTGNAAHGTRGALQVIWRGPDKPAYVVVITEAPQNILFSPAVAATCDVLMTATSLVANESPIEFTASHPNGATAEVTEGGIYDANNQFAGPCSCNPCCQGDATPPDEVTVSYTHPPGLIAHIMSYWGVSEPEAVEMATTDYGSPPEGDHVLTRVSGSCSQWLGSHFSFEVLPCAVQTPVQPRDRRIWTPILTTEYDPAGVGTPVDTHECNHCNKKCMTVMSGSQGHAYGENFCVSRCIDTPQCGPAAGSYQYRIRTNLFTGFGTATIS